MEDKNTTLTLAFTSLEVGWPFMDFKMQVSSLSYFLTLQQQLKQHHGCIKNIKIYLDYEKKNPLVYGTFEKIGQKLLQNNQNNSKNGIMTTGKQICLYYEFDNAYEWPLLSF